MKKCPYCEVKKKLKKFRTHGNFFSRCDHCKQYEWLIAEKKRLNSCNFAAYSRAELLEKWIGGTGY